MQMPALQGVLCSPFTQMLLFAIQTLASLGQGTDLVSCPRLPVRRQRWRVHLSMFLQYHKTESSKGRLCTL